MIPVLALSLVLARFRRSTTRSNIRSTTPVSATSRRSCRDPSAHYDELPTLEAALNEIRLGRAAVSRREILVKGAAPRPLPRLARIEAAQLIKAIKDNFTVSIADNAFGGWWFTACFVLRHQKLVQRRSLDGLGPQRCHDPKGGWHFCRSWRCGNEAEASPACSHLISYAPAMLSPPSRTLS